MGIPRGFCALAVVVVCYSVSCEAHAEQKSFTELKELYCSEFLHFVFVVVKSCLRPAILVGGTVRFNKFGYLNSNEMYLPSIVFLSVYFNNHFIHRTFFLRQN